MQKQQIARFPGLIGKFTRYSNDQFKASVEATRDRLGPIFKKGAVFPGLPALDSARDVMDMLPGPMRLTIASHPKIRDIHTDEDLNEKISSLEWYELGAPLGFFNVYTQEYDAEAYAMWVCCPEEFEAMYKRAGSVVSGVPEEQIWNQATYVSVRGINETNMAAYV
jgi:hypothetical protein